ncbi:TetR/AcrR family transcriptional regulator [Streptomyces sp. NPDC048641]|uniref:TetR/AcrR family transcriptional regulator n=1 Tax=Streptomyces sp. NPDC048641 TaxID=3154825 RepID=UPI0034276E84
MPVIHSAGRFSWTYRALSERLATGPGAIYWHVAGKGELLGAATDAVLAGAVTAGASDATPQDAIRSLALGVFDDHPWIGTQLARAPGQSPMPRVFENIGRQVQALGVPAAAQFSVASAVWNYILGVAGQNAANARPVRPETDRTEFLNAVSAVWADLDPDEYAFTRGVAGRLRDHDDRTEFLSGIDLILTGITAGR